MRPKNRRPIGYLPAHNHRADRRSNEERNSRLETVMPRKIAVTLENNAWISRKRVVADYVPARRDEAVVGR
jgi:hypothetical protein